MVKKLFTFFLLTFSAHCFSGATDTSEKLSKSITEIFDKAEYSSFSGVVLVAKDGKEILNISLGKADIERGIPFSSETLIDIGSITKQFTAAAILKLEMQGKLSTKDKAHQYVPSLTGDLQKITIHELLTHTAGITSDTGDDDDTFTSGNLVKHLNNLQLSQSTGVHKYSNLGYSLLALIVENVSGEPLDQFLAKSLFAPIGMSKTGYTYSDYKDKEVSRGYLNSKDWGYPHKKNWSKSGPYWNLRGNGGMLSTAKDMHKWLKALHFGEYLSGKAKQNLFAMHVREFEGVESYYGYGWVTEILHNKKKVIWHNGGNGIFSADVRYYPSSNIHYFIAGNRSDAEVFDISDEIHNIVSQM